MKKQIAIMLGFFALLFVGLFLITNVVKAANNCGAVNCDMSTQVCCLTGCKSKSDGCGGSGTGVIGNPIIGSLNGQTGVSFLQSFLPKIIGLAFVVGVVIFFFMLIMGAIKWISSSGDKQALENAKGTITNAIIGLVILFATFVIAKLIQSFFGFSILTLDIGSLII